MLLKKLSLSSGDSSGPRAKRGVVTNAAQRLPHLTEFFWEVLCHFDHLPSLSKQFASTTEIFSHRAYSAWRRTILGWCPVDRDLVATKLTREEFELSLQDEPGHVEADRNEKTYLH